MNKLIRRGAVIVTAVAAAMALSSHVLAEPSPRTQLAGLIHDYTPALDAGGPWVVVGHWTLKVNTVSEKVEFLASLSMLRSSEAVPRTPHTHHIEFNDGEVTEIAGGYRIIGTASFTSNGSPAPFTQSPVYVEITGGSAVPYANVAVIFIGAAAQAHFGPQIKGVVAEQP